MSAGVMITTIHMYMYMYMYSTLIGRWGIARNAVDKVDELFQPDSTQPTNCKERQHMYTHVLTITPLRNLKFFQLHLYYSTLPLCERAEHDGACLLGRHISELKERPDAITASTVTTEPRGEMDVGGGQYTKLQC